MDVRELATSLNRKFLGFRGGADELLRELLAQNPGALRDVPSQPFAFRRSLKAVAPDLLALGVSVTIFEETGMIQIKSASDAQMEAREEASLRASYFSKLPEAVELRKEF